MLHNNINTNKLVLCMLTSAAAISSSSHFALSIVALLCNNTTTKEWKQIPLLNMSNIVQILSFTCLLTIVFLCIYKAVIKYQLTLKESCCILQQAYSSLEFDFTGPATNKMPASFTSSNIITTSSKKQYCCKRPSHQNNIKSSPPLLKAASNTVPQVTTTTNTNTAASDFTAATSKCDSEWTVYKTKKAKRSSSKAPTKTSPRRRCSVKTPIPAVAVITATPATTTANITPTTVTAISGTITNGDNNNKIELSNAEKRKRLQIKTLLPLRQPFNNNNNFNYNNCVAEDVLDVPWLVSDNDSDSQASVESPRLSTRVLLPAQQQQTGYYSPFSTGFDFDVASSSLTTSMTAFNSKDETKFYPATGQLLNNYLTSQEPYNIPSVKNISNYTPSISSKKAYNILKLLDPSNDPIETTITPKAFQYFDEMLISNSLYNHCPTKNIDDSLFLRNKREWNSFAR